jgi:hypothetical protein
VVAAVARWLVDDSHAEWLHLQGSYASTTILCLMKWNDERADLNILCSMDAFSL